MPLGSRQNNNFLHLIMDVWRDQIFFNETVYPTGHFAAELLNVPEETMRELVTHGGAISHQVKALALVGRSEFIKLLDGTRTSLEKLLDALWRCPPYSLMDKGQELHTLEVLFSPASHNDLLKLDSPAREFFLRYLVAAFSIPLGIQHFAVAARYFEEGYLRRLKKRTETYFAMAAHDCFNSEWFWSMMRDLPVPDIEPFTITPELRSSYVFARHPKQEKETVFVNRYFFDHVISFYIFDLMNGLQHGHAPSRRHDAAEGAKQTAPGLPPVHHPHQHHPQAPKISDELRNEALYVAESLRDKALMDNDYAASGYARDMEQEAIYAQARARLAREEKP